MDVKSKGGAWPSAGVCVLTPAPPALPQASSSKARPSSHSPRARYTSYDCLQLVCTFPAFGTNSPRGSIVSLQTGPAKLLALTPQVPQRLVVPCVRRTRRLTVAGPFLGHAPSLLSKCTPCTLGSVGETKVSQPQVLLGSSQTALSAFYAPVIMLSMCHKGSHLRGGLHFVDKEGEPWRGEVPFLRPHFCQVARFECSTVTRPYILLRHTAFRTQQRTREGGVGRGQHQEQETEGLPHCQARDEGWLGASFGALNSKGDFNSFSCPLTRAPVATSGGIFGCHKCGSLETREAAKLLQNVGQPPQHRITQPRMSRVLRLRNPTVGH